MPFLDDQHWHHLSNSYTYLTNHIVPGPRSSSYFIPFFLLPLALLIPPTTLFHNALAALFLPIIYGCQTHAWLQSGIDVVSINLTLWSFVLLVWRDPRRSFRRLWVVDGDVGRKGEGKGEYIKEEPYPVEIVGRLKWVLTLLVSLRLTGWKIGDPSHDKMQPPPRMSRSAFLKVALRTVLLSYFILDVSSCYVRSDPYFVTSNMGVDAPDMPKALGMLRLLPPRLLRSSVLAGQIFAMVTTMFFLPTLPAVGLNALGLLPDEWSPHTWPVFFGDFSAIGERGLRGLWGSWWHGINRHITATHGRVAAESLEIPPKSFLGYALLVVSAFFFSGIIHMGMIPPEPKSMLLSANVMRLYVAGFFWAQIPAFGIELAATKLVEWLAPKLLRWPGTKAFVLLWVAAWLCLTLPFLAVPFREIGYWHYHAVPVSVSRGLAGKGWFTW